MEQINLLLKGFLIGIGKIIPGVSGSMIAMSLGVYEKGIEILSNLISGIRNHFKFVFFLGTGVLLAIFFFSSLISALLEHYFFFTMFLFIGLIVGTIPTITSKISNQKINKKNIFFFFLSAFFVLFLAFLKNNATLFEIQKNEWGSMLIGFIDAATMIIPGISGTAILMILGCYNVYLELCTALYDNIYYVFFFGLGFLCGIILIAKTVKYLLEKHETNSYYSIIGFSFSSVAILFLNTISANPNLFEFIVGVCLCIIGYKLSKKLNRS